MDEILTPFQVAELLKIHVKTVYRLAREGSIAGNRVGRSWRFSKSHILNLLFDQQGKLPAQKDSAKTKDGRSL